MHRTLDFQHGYQPLPRPAIGERRTRRPGASPASSAAELRLLNRTHTNGFNMCGSFKEKKQCLYEIGPLLPPSWRSGVSP